MRLLGGSNNKGNYSARIEEAIKAIEQEFSFKIRLEKRFGGIDHIEEHLKALEAAGHKLDDPKRFKNAVFGVLLESRNFQESIIEWLNKTCRFRVISILRDLPEPEETAKDCLDKAHDFLFFECKTKPEKLLDIDNLLGYIYKICERRASREQKKHEMTSSINDNVFQPEGKSYYPLSKDSETQIKHRLNLFMTSYFVGSTNNYRYLQLLVNENLDWQEDAEYIMEQLGIENKNTYDRRRNVVKEQLKRIINDQAITGDDRETAGYLFEAYLVSKKKIETNLNLVDKWKDAA
ncbi:MAG: class I SAM-dependent methyltransferase [Cytophagales bacterium]|nr:class I SAM-dependent methyltransferase [Cytophagales bacterium]